LTLAYPVAASGMDALTSPLGLERTRAAAGRVAGRKVVLSTEWLRPGPERAAELESAIQMAISTGAAQIYESEKGRPVIALNYWRPMTDEELAPQPAPAKPDKARDDHADDLYFRRGRTKKTRPKPVDPNQMDMFISERDTSDPEAASDKDES
jgi:hypothetical protein